MSSHDNDSDEEDVAIPLPKYAAPARKKGGKMFTMTTTNMVQSTALNNLEMTFSSCVWSTFEFAACLSMLPFCHF